MLEMNLQLFAEDIDDEEIEDAGYIGEPDEEEETQEEETGVEEVEEKTENDEQEEELEETEEKPKKDKKELAIIKAKRENKKLKDQLAKFRELEQEKNKKNKIDELVDKGYGEEAAERMINQDFEVAEIKKQLQVAKIEKLESECPGISEVAEEVYDLVQKTGLTADEVYRAKFNDLSIYDVRTKAEQEVLYKQNKAKSKKSATPTSKAPSKQTKLTGKDKLIYEELRKTKQFKGLTVEQFKEMVAEEEF